MTKELVKSENGHKIMKHARHNGTHSLSSGSRIKMRFTTPWLVVLLLSLASGDSSSSSADLTSLLENTDGNTDDDQLKTSVSTDNAVLANNGIPYSDQTEKSRNSDDNDLLPDKDTTVEEILLFESLLSDDDDDKVIEQNSQNLDVNKGNEKSEDNDSILGNPIKSEIRSDVIDVGRQGEINPEIKLQKSDPDIEFDDSKQEITTDTPPRYGQRSQKSKLKYRDEAPLLQLTQGGYDRPYKQPRFRNRYISRADSSEQSENVQEPGRNMNRQSGTRRIVPHVTYSPSPQPPYAFGPGPVVNPGFDAPARNMLAINPMVPATMQNGYFNAPPASFPDYRTNAFQTQFPQGNEIVGFPNFIRDPNNGAFYQTSQSNPFQSPGILYHTAHTAPQVQQQPVLIDPTRNVQPQLQPNPFAAYAGFENLEDTSRPNYAAYFRNPAATSPFQVPQNFYGNGLSRGNAISNPSVNFLPNYPSADDRLSSQFFRYPLMTNAQNNQVNSNEQHIDSDASQEEKKAKMEEQEAGKPSNRGISSSVPFGTRLQAQNEADVYMRYPTNEAGYAIEENLPPQNNSEEPKDGSQQTSSEQRNFPSSDPYRNALNSVRSNQRINNSFDFPLDLFRDVPIDFGYQRPQSDVFNQYPERNRVLPRYPNPNFESRNPFDPIPSLPENNYQFPNADDQRRGQEESDEIPSCAKQNNASVCFEDSEYPGNDILYSINSNTFLADRILGPKLQLNPAILVERNASDTEQNTENYACTVDTTYGTPLRAKNLAGVWKIIVNLQGKFSQPVRMEICKSLGEACNYADSRFKTTCVQKYNLQRLLTWSPGRGIYSDVYKIPVACSCQIMETAQV